MMKDGYKSVACSSYSSYDTNKPVNRGSGATILEIKKGGSEAGNRTRITPKCWGLAKKLASAPYQNVRVEKPNPAEIILLCKVKS